MDLITTKFIIIHNLQSQGRIMQAFKDMYPTENTERSDLECECGN